MTLISKTELCKQVRFLLSGSHICLHLELSDAYVALIIQLQCTVIMSNNHDNVTVSAKTRLVRTRHAY